MNSCNWCNSEFKYWQVWRSYWRGSIKCSSCTKLNSTRTARRLLQYLFTIGLPLILVGQLSPIFWPSASIAFEVLVLIIFIMCFSFLTPLFKMYGK